VIARAKRLFMAQGDAEVSNLLRNRRLCHEREQEKIVDLVTGNVQKSYVLDPPLR